jgi:hypothetical protein
MFVQLQANRARCKKTALSVLSVLCCVCLTSGDGVQQLGHGLSCSLPGCQQRIKV